jgi:hypothetical protein
MSFFLLVEQVTQAVQQEPPQLPLVNPVVCIGFSVSFSALRLVAVPRVFKKCYCDSVLFCMQAMDW